MKSVKPIHMIISTVAAAMDIAPYLNLLAPKGAFAVVGVPNKPYELPAGPIISKQLRVIGSLIGSRHVIRDMLDFAVLHDIKPQIEELPLTPAGCTEAFD